MCTALPGLLADGPELACALLAPFLRIVVADDFAVVVQQIAVAVALEDGAEIPAMAVIVGELGVVQLGIEVIDIAQEIQVRPVAARRGAFRIAVQHLAHLVGGRIFLLLRPHDGASAS